MGTTKTTWWDKENNQHEGYIKDGLTYVDEAGTERIPVGATVKTNGGTYKMTSSGGVPTAATVRNRYQQNTNAAINAYQAAGKVQEDRINAATDAAVAEINRQKKVAETNRIDADRAAREAYLKAANPFGALEEQRVRLGLDNSGYAESSKLRLASDYAATVNANLRAKNEQLQSLDVQIAQAKAQGQYELANMLEARAQTVMQQKVAMENNLSSLDMQAISQAESARQFEENMAYQIARNAVLDERYKTEWDYGVKIDERDFNYNKGIDERNFNYNKSVDERDFNYNKNIDERDFNYNKGIDERNFNYQKSQDAAARAARSSGGSSGGGGGSSQSKYYNDVKSTAKKYENAYDAYNYLAGRVDDGYITNDEAFYIYETVLGYNREEYNKGYKEKKEEAGKETMRKMFGGVLGDKFFQK
ncbi:MAG: hypothetical protein IJN97_02790 [Oscillospiraceae bacterium]|nr:hypothetical protein [Oscillospiraceae bacterium]